MKSIDDLAAIIPRRRDDEHAENGDFALAAAWQAKALEMNGRVWNMPDDEIKSAESRLEVCKAGKPWRDPE